MITPGFQDTSAFFFFSLSLPSLLRVGFLFVVFLARTGYSRNLFSNSDAILPLDPVCWYFLVKHSLSFQGFYPVVLRNIW